MVHTQIFDGEQKPYFHQGDYFVKTTASHPLLMPPGSGGPLQSLGTLRGAGHAARFSCSRFSIGSRKWATSPEAIINQLMGDDEEHRRDEFENDYMLDSNVETFENLTDSGNADCRLAFTAKEQY